MVVLLVLVHAAPLGAPSSSSRVKGGVSLSLHLSSLSCRESAGTRHQSLKELTIAPARSSLTAKAPPAAAPLCRRFVSTKYSCSTAPGRQRHLSFVINCKDVAASTLKVCMLRNELLSAAQFRRWSIHSAQVVFVATECSPWCKVGGLADVLSALPSALAARWGRLDVCLLHGDRMHRLSPTECPHQSVCFCASGVWM